MEYFCEILAFALFFLGDCNDWKWGRAALRACFPAGVLLLAAAAARQCVRGAERPLALRLSFGFLGAAFLGLLVYTLFFALPAKDAYARQETGRQACTVGVYALCRHPGVLWLAGVFLCLWAGFGLPLLAVLLTTALNLGLVAFEDGWVFPAQLAGYEDYRRETPFLLPTRASIRRCRETLGRD